jgi:hypothetical protein
LQVLIALLTLALLIWPRIFSDDDDLETNHFDRTRIP